MSFSVFLIHDAEDDILEIYDWIRVHESEERADYVYSEIRKSCTSLAEFPGKGHYPPELERLEVRTFREIHFKHYRILYQIFGKKGFIHCVLDGRRDMQSLLVKRLLRV